MGKLNIARVACPDSDLEDQIFPVTLSTSGAGDHASTSCGGAGQSDRAFHWVVPSDGLYAFKAVAAGYSAVISVLDGPRCKDTELGCSAAIQELRDMIYQLDIPGPGAGCSADCTVTVSSPGTITAYLLDENDCSGREIDCKNSSFGGDVTLEVSSANNDAGTYTLVVSEAALDSPDYTIRIDCMQICS